MKLNAKDIQDLEEAIYWASACKTDLEGLVGKSNLCTPEELAAHALESVAKVDVLVSGVLLGTNRPGREASR